MATASETLRLSRAHRAAQVRRAAAIAALVSVYYRKRVQIEDPASLERWLQIMLPRIISEHNRSARDAARFGDILRKLEVPEAKDGFRFQPSPNLTPEQIRASLVVVGPANYLKKAREIRELDTTPSMKQALLEQARETSAANITGSVVRHVQNGGRHTIQENIRRDRVAIGFARVTRGNPCYFCAMLASRGLVYTEDSFDMSDPRFTGPGDSKVHDNCQCALKPVYSRDDSVLDANKRFEQMWYEYANEGDGGMLINFRRGYEGRQKAA